MANPADLIQLWSDPAVAAEFVQAAIKGDVDARRGRGVEQGKARAERAIGQGDTHAAVPRLIVAAKAVTLINTFNASPGSATRRNRSERRTNPSRTVRH